MLQSLIGRLYKYELEIYMYTIMSEDSKQLHELLQEFLACGDFLSFLFWLLRNTRVYNRELLFVKLCLKGKFIQI